jgi:hypothetical protein
MAPVMELEAENERSLEIEKRRRVLIAAAVAAVAGVHSRILEITTAEESGRGGLPQPGPYLEEVARVSRPRRRAKARGGLA